MNFNGKWKIVAYCDSNFGGDKNSRNSVSGFCIYVGSYLVSWRSRSQKGVLLLSTEAEYYAVSKVCMDIIFINIFLEFLRLKIEFPITVWCDNVRAIFFSYNAKNSNKTKHSNIRAHYVQKFVEDGVVKIVFVRLTDNEADVFTKNVSGKIFETHATNNLTEVGQKQEGC